MLCKRRAVDNGASAQQMALDRRKDCMGLLRMNLSQLSATEIALVAMCSVPVVLTALLFLFA
jgi:hypothetical protein